MKVVCLAVMGYLLCFEVTGQSVTKRYFDRAGFETDSARSLYFEILIFDNDDADPRTLSYYTSNGKVRSTEALKDIHGEKLKKFYYPSGELKSEGHFRRSVPSGLFQSYYENGKHQSELVFELRDSSGFKDPVVGVVNYYDSAGNALVTNGEGYCQCNLSPYSDEEVVEKGKVEKGLKVGEWLGESKGGEETYSYKEIYEHGILFHGFQYRGGKTYEYEKINMPAQPSDEFDEHIADHLHYPRNAKRRNIEGKVWMEFVVGISGYISQVHVIKGIDEECDREAERVIKTSPPWNSAQIRGINVRRKVTLPVTFKLR